MVGMGNSQFAICGHCTKDQFAPTQNSHLKERANWAKAAPTDIHLGLNFAAKAAPTGLNFAAKAAPTFFLVVLKFAAKAAPTDIHLGLNFAAKAAPTFFLIALKFAAKAAPTGFLKNVGAALAANAQRVLKESGLRPWRAKSL
jgi:hypothetical protein